MRWLMCVIGLMLGTAAMTLHRARRRELDAHRAWAIRLYALAIGSWLYRMDYGFWLLLTDGLGHADGFSGPFDYFMDFFFYVPNLLVAEAWLRARSSPTLLVRALLVVATGFVLLGTYFFAMELWFPAMADAIGG